MNWSPQQDAALAAIKAWFDGGGQQPFYLAGYAGTGKTTLAKEVLNLCTPNALFAAFTGKAALVLAQKGCPGASTIHSLIYLPKGKSRARLEQLEQAVKTERDPNTRAKLLHAIEWERANLQRPSFALREESPVRDADLVVIDEVSMLDARIGADLESFGTPILVLGDPAQLPPVAGGGYFTERKPDVMLTEIHRQAADNPIIRLATDVRQGRGLHPGAYGESRVITKADEGETLAQAAGADQMLCGLNKTRRAINNWVREGAGCRSPYPEEGDKLVCLRNDRDTGLLNGSLWRVLASAADGETVGLSITDDAGVEMTVEAWAGTFDEKSPIPDSYWERCNAQEFDYGYALTCHKAQGSQWPNVFVYDESRRFRSGDPRRWTYTAITRAAEKVTVVL